MLGEMDLRRVNFKTLRGAPRGLFLMNRNFCPKLCFLFIASGSMCSCLKSREVLSNSQVAGHYEASTAVDFKKYENKLRLVPEYAPNQNIVVSEQLFALAEPTLFRQILDAGASRIYVMMKSPTADENVQQGLKALLLQRMFSGAWGDGRPLSQQHRAAIESILPMVTPVEQLTPVFRPAGDTGTTVWARDWSPLSAFAQSGEGILMDFNYAPTRPSDDAVPMSLSQFFQDMRAQFSSVPIARVSMPLYMEGGNFMNTAEWCFTTDRVVKTNSRVEKRFVFTQQHAEKSNGYVTADEFFDKTGVMDLLGKFGCKRVEIFDAMPFEGTGHVDMWAKVVSENTVLVADLGDHTISFSQGPQADAIRGPHRTAAEDLADLKKIQLFLRGKQEWFRNNGFRVLALPMPLPLFFVSEERISTAELGYLMKGVPKPEARMRAIKDATGTIFRSYTNSLYLNGTLLTPRYKEFYRGDTSIPYPDGSLTDAYEKSVRENSEQGGFRIRFSDSDKLIISGGSIHCATMQIPW